MTVVEMHVMFRELAQQMGMQTVRAILSEDIDTCLNIAVNDYIKKVIADNVKMSGNNKIYIDNAKIGQINVLRTLIDKLEISNITINEEENKFTAEINNNNVFLFTSSYIYYNDIFGGFSARIVDNDYLYSTLISFSSTLPGIGSGFSSTLSFTGKPPKAVTLLSELPLDLSDNPKFNLALLLLVLFSIIKYSLI